MFLYYCSQQETSLLYCSFLFTEKSHNASLRTSEKWDLSHRCWDRKMNTLNCQVSRDTSSITSKSKTTHLHGENQQSFLLRASKEYQVLHKQKINVSFTFRKYQKKSIFSIPMKATPAAEPMISIEPPVPAQNATSCQNSES